MSPFSSRQTAYPSPTPYFYDMLKDHATAWNYTDYSPSTLVSPVSEQGSMQFQDTCVDADFTFSIAVKATQKQGRTYAKAAALSYPPPRPRSACDPRFLGPHWPNQPGNGTLINNTVTDIRRPRSPSSASRMSDGKVSRRRQPPPPPPPERRSPRYLCEFCDKKFNTPSERKYVLFSSATKTFY